MTPLSAKNPEALDSIYFQLVVYARVNQIKLNLEVFCDPARSALKGAADLSNLLPSAWIDVLCKEQLRVSDV